MCFSAAMVVVVLTLDVSLATVASIVVGVAALLVAIDGDLAAVLMPPELLMLVNFEDVGLAAVVLTLSLFIADVSFANKLLEVTGIFMVLVVSIL